MPTANFLAWLNRSESTKIYLLTLELRFIENDAIATEYLRVSNYPYNTLGGDIPGLVEFIAVLSAESIPRFSQLLSEPFTGVASLDYGRFMLNNTSGVLTDKLPPNRVWEGGLWQLKLTGPREQLDLADGEVIGTGVIGKPSWTGRRVEVPVYSRHKGLAEAKMPVATFAGPGDEEILSPLAYGSCYNVKPILRNAVDLIYRAAQQVTFFSRVMDRGVALTYESGWTQDPYNGDITLLAAPQGVITCDLLGKPTTTVDDDFTIDSSGVYVSGGDSAATWTWDTENGQLTATGGTRATLLHVTPYVEYALIEVTMTQAEQAGLIGRWLDNNNYYLLTIADDSSASGDANLRLYKRSGGTFSPLAAAVTTPVWPRGEEHTISLMVVGNTPTSVFAYFDGVLMTSAIDVGTTTGSNWGLSHHSATAAMVTSLRIAEPQGGRGYWIKDALMTYADIAEADIDDSVIDLESASFASTESESNIYLTQQLSVLEFCRLLVHPMLASLIQTRVGVFRVAQLTAATTIPVLTITESEILDTDGPAFALVPHLYHQAILQYEENHTVQDEDSLGASGLVDPATQAGRERRLWLSKEWRETETTLQGALDGTRLYPTAQTLGPIKSFFASRLDAADMVTQWLVIFGVDRRLVTISLKLQPVQVQLNDVVTVTFGSQLVAAACRIVGIEEDYGHNRMSLKVLV